MTVLVAPHVSEKTARWPMQNGNQYVFRVRRDADQARDQGGRRADVRGQGRRACSVVNEPGKAKRFGRTPGPHAGLEEGLRAPGRGPDIDFAGAEKRVEASLRSNDGTHQDQADVARHALRRQGRPLAPAQGRAARGADRRARSSTGARNNYGPHHHAPQGRWPQHQLPRSSTSVRDKDGIAGQGRAPRVRPEPHARTSRWCCTPTASAATSSRRRAWQPATTIALGRRRADQGRQRDAAAPHPDRHARCTTSS